MLSTTLVAAQCASSTHGGQAENFRTVSHLQAMADEKGKQLLNEAFDELERETPDRVTHIIRWLRTPEARRVRLPLGILCIILSFFWFLPVIGIELLPIGLLLIAVDVPFLRRPVGQVVLWLEDRWVALRRWWRRRRKKRTA